MKRFKKVFAVLLTLAMVLGMSITTFAAGSATITVNGLPTDREIKLEYVKVIEADQTTSTGWAFSSPEIQMIYINAFKAAEAADINATDAAATDRNSEAAQNVIKQLISIAKGEVSDTTGTNSTEIAQALSGVRNSDNVTFTEMSGNGQQVTEAGVYAIKATEKTPEGEVLKYTFNTMAAYVGFGEVKDEEGNVTGSYPTLMDTSVTAKMSEITFDKSEDDTDDVVGVGDIVDFTIKVTVPYVEAGRPLTEKTFFIYDEVQGGEYTALDTATIKMGDTDLKATEENGGYGAAIVATDNNTKFSIDLSNLINTANTNAGKEVIVSYKVKVTGTQTIDNKAYAGHKDDSYDDAHYGKDDEKLYTGIITVTKTDEGTTPLENAGFEVTINDEIVYFTKTEAGVYQRVVTEDVPDDVKTALDQAAEKNSTNISELEVKKDNVTYVRQVFTKADGTIKLNGLDVGTYKITEKTAPEGYSINENIEDVTLEVKEGENAEIEEGTGNLVAIENIAGERSVQDTKLSALPSTGGIGTTIFTIGGCAIIIVAAGLFFASRRKSAK